MKKAIDITGQRFGTLTALNLLPERSKHNQKMWKCVCDCGNITNILQHSLTTGNTTKCKNHPKNNYEICGDYVLLDVSTPSLPNTMSKIDLEDLDRVLQYKRKGNRLKWIAHDSAPGYDWGTYVMDTNRKNRLHRFILKLDDPILIVDHINGDTLDNRKENLKIITRQENNKNQRKRINNKTGYTGVVFDKKCSLYIASVQLHNKKLFLGRFDTIEQANIAYRSAIKVLNFSDRHGL